MTENQKLREAFESRMTDNGKWPRAVEQGRNGCYLLAQTENAWAEWQACAEALALPTADHLPDVKKMVVDHFPDATKMIETAAPAGEREAFERTMMDKYGWQNEDFKLDDFGYFDGHTDTAWMAWQARAALSAGDAVLAEREACAKLCEEVADDLITAMRKEGETDDEVMTSLVASARVCAEEIRGGYSKKFNPHNAAIDAAMRKDKL